MRKGFLLVFFLLQLAAIISAQSMYLRYFAWAPFDQINFYEIEVKKNDISLTDDEVNTRYHFLSGRENRSIHHVFDQLSQFESTYFRGDSIELVVTYRTNGKFPDKWIFKSY
jgi:hypothetical protein